ncbi:MAG TPA: hypothetical protein VFZ73_06740 [Gemmatimonadaceae bacterium]
MTFLVLIPLLAMFGVFGESQAQAHGASADLELRVDYPTRYRYKQIDRVRVEVQNVSGAQLDTVTVAFDSSYTSRFSTLMFIPAAKEPFSVELTHLAPGSTRLVWVELQAERYGRHRGALRAWRHGGSDTVSVALSTIIFP